MNKLTTDEGEWIGKFLRKSLIFFAIIILSMPFVLAEQILNQTTYDAAPVESLCQADANAANRMTSLTTTTAGNVTIISVLINATGTPTSSLSLSVYGGSNTFLMAGNGTINAGNISNALKWFNFTLNKTLNMAASTQYRINLKCSASSGGVQYYWMQNTSITGQTCWYGASTPATNSEGGSEQDTFILYTDTGGTSPTITITLNTPLNNSVINNSIAEGPLNFTVNATGTSVVNCSIQENATTILGQFDNVANYSNHQYTLPVQARDWKLNAWNVTCCIGATAQCISPTVKASSPTFYFYINDTIKPSLTVQYPVNLSILTNLTMSYSLNFTASDPRLDKCWYQNVTGGILALASCANSTFKIINASWQNITVFANDSFNNINLSQIFFNYSEATGWPHKIDGVQGSAINKIVGVLRTAVAKVIGVA